MTTQILASQISVSTQSNFKPNQIQNKISRPVAPVSNNSFQFKTNLSQKYDISSKQISQGKSVLRSSIANSNSGFKSVGIFASSENNLQKQAQNNNIANNLWQHDEPIKFTPSKHNNIQYKVNENFSQNSKIKDKQYVLYTYEQLMQGKNQTQKQNEVKSKASPPSLKEISQGLKDILKRNDNRVTRLSNNEESKYLMSKLSMFLELTDQKQIENSLLRENNKNLDKLVQAYQRCRQGVNSSQKIENIDFKIDEINGGAPQIQACMIDNFYSDVDLDCYQNEECYAELLWEEQRSQSYAENQIFNDFNLQAYKKNQDSSQNTLAQ